MLLNSNLESKSNAVKLAAFANLGQITFNDDLDNYKVVFLVTLFGNFVLNTSCQFPKSGLTKNWLCTFNDGTVRNVQLFNITSKTAEVDKFNNVTAGYVFGIK